MNDATASSATTFVNAVRSMRVTPDIELEGLDVPEFGMLGHPEDIAVAES